MNAYQLVPIPESDNPWPQDLRPYVDRETDFFCGRRREREIILANLLSARVTILHGPSGVGKSSILWAGVLPDLRTRIRETALPDAPLAIGVYIRDWTGNPTRDLTHAVRDAVSSQGVDVIEGLDCESAGFRDLLRHRVGQRSVHLFILLDQVEDIFLASDPSALVQFRQELSQTVRDPSIGVNVLLGIRQDWLGALEYFKTSMPGIYDNSLTLSDLDEKGAEAVINEPVETFNRLHGGSFTVRGELTAEILTQVRTVRRQSARSTISTPFGPEANGYPAAYLGLIMNRLWRDKGDVPALGPEALNAIEGGVSSIVQDHVDRAMKQFHIDDRTVAAFALGELVTGAGSIVDFPLLSLDVPDPSFSKERLDRVVAALEDRFRMVHSVGEGRYRVFHDLLITPIQAWLRNFQSTESYAGFPRVFHQALRIIKRAKHELWWLNFVLRFGEPHLNNTETVAEYHEYTGEGLEHDVAECFRVLLEKAGQLDFVRVMTLSEEGAREFLNGLRKWQKQGDASGDGPITSETLKVQALLDKIEEAVRDFRQRLTDAGTNADPPTSRQFLRTSSLPIQLIIADNGANGKLCCLAFMVGSEAYRAGERREGIVGAHYTEDPALVEMYRNLAIVLMKQSGVRAVWPTSMDAHSLDVAGESIRRQSQAARVSAPSSPGVVPAS